MVTRMNQGLIPPSKLMALLEQYLNYYFATAEISEKTKQNYRIYQKNIVLYFEHIDPDISEVKAHTIEDFSAFAMSRGDMTFRSRCIELIKNVLKYAQRRGHQVDNFIFDISTKRAKIKEVVHLERNELQKFIYPLLRDRENQIARDLYIFQSETGMSFGDLTSYQIIKDQVGEWIFNKRCKTNNQYWVPLSPEAKRIHEKYNGKMPKICLSVYNQKLKDVAQKSGINKNLSSHTARKTFATLKYEAGWSLESIADMMGISVLILTKHYIKKSRKRLENEVVEMAKKVLAESQELKIKALQLNH